MALLGLKCIYKWKELKSIHRALVEGYETLGGLQKLDGSFGNIHRTALIIQVRLSILLMLFLESCLILNLILILYTIITNPILGTWF